MPQTAVTISAQFDTFMYAIGDSSVGQGGGKVFFIDTLDRYPNWTYLEAAPADISGTFAWASSLYENYAMDTANGMGAGLGNTNNILGVDTAPTAAAAACRAYEGGGKTDWYLPSLAELSQMHTRRNIIGSFVTDGTYWSSTEAGSGYALFTTFTNSTFPGAGSHAKGVSHLVRPIRRF
jgi:hypothetical protein